MTDSRRSGDDPTLPDIRRDPTVQVLLQEPFDDELAEQRDAGENEDITSFAVRLDAWRRHYLPLPDEVVHEYLGEDEYVVHTDHPSFRAFLIKNSVQVLGLGAVFLIFMVVIRNGFDLWTVGLFLVMQVVLAFMALKRLSDRYTSYVITNLRLIRLSGVFGRKLASIPWTRMTGLGYRQKPMGRILGYATIFIESANEESGLREFSDINDPAAFHQKILDMMSAKSGQSSKDIPPPTRGERKSFLTRRRERRIASLKRARLTAKEVARSRKSVKGDGLPDLKQPRSTGGDGGGFPSKKQGAPLPPKGDAAMPAAPGPGAGPAMPEEPSQSSQPATPRNHFWPGSGGPPDPDEPVDTGAAPPPVKPAPPEKPAPKRAVPPPPPPAPPAPSPSASAPPTPPRRRFSIPTPRRPTRLTRPTPPTAPPTPKREPPTVAPKVSAPPPPDDRSPRVHRWWRNYRTDDTTSARDALAALREGQRQTRPARRVRLPNFGRPRSPLPESRQLPAKTQDPTEETPPGDS